jgi:hypothetical protein
MKHDFGLRFRHDSETEGYGSLLVKFAAEDMFLSSTIKRMVTDVARQHPTTQFDGMVYYGTRYT